MLAPHHITDVYCVVDDLLPRSTYTTGRPLTLSDSEVVTMLIWNMLTTNSKTLKGVYKQMCLYHNNDFPLVSYQTFVRRTHECFSHLVLVLNALLHNTASVRILDSTMLPVCKLARADEHKTAQTLASFGKNWQGWHYGFKLHASIDLKGRLCGFVFTTASIHDLHGMDHILNEHCDVAVGDTLYGAKVMGRIMYEKYGTKIVAPPHPTQKRKITTVSQNALRSISSKIESTFDVLKEHLHLVSSFPRSIKGLFVHYLRVLIGYQLSLI